MIKANKLVKAFWGFSFWLSFFFLLGCSAHSPFIIKNTTDTRNVSTIKYPPHTNKVFLTKESLPEESKFEVIAMIEVGKVWYGSSGKVYESIAARARELGADAVIEIKTWHQPSGWSWAAPHGSGKAIRFTDRTSIDFSNLKGEWK